MTQQQQKIIFNEFTQASREISHRYGGSGLGLSISRKLATVMGGSISVESEIGFGTRFTLWLPGLQPVVNKLPVDDRELVLLYEEKFHATEKDVGSVSCAIRASGRNVHCVPEITLLQRGWV
jgi:hypothetical protein